MGSTQNNFLVSLSILYRNTQKFFDKVLAQYDIGSGQLMFLFYINENEGVTMQEVSRYCEVDKGTTTKSIQKLIEQGYVNAQTDEEDHRIKRLYTTAKAVDIMTALYEYRNELRSRLETGIEFTVFEEMLRNAAANSRTLEPEPRYNGIRIGGMQKMTLLDYPGKVAATIFTSGCNFKCPFCHNKELVFIPENYQFFEPEDVLAYLEKRRGLLDGVCISGGEPLMQEGLVDFIRDIRKLGYPVKLDTNGYYPDRLKALLDEGLLDYIAMDVKNSPSHYAVTVGMSNENLTLEKIQKSMELIKESGISYEYRTTVVKELHSLEDLKEIAEWISYAPHYYLQQYLESENVIQKGWSAYSAEEMEEIRREVAHILPAVELRGVKEV